MRASTVARTGVGAGGVAMAGFGVWNLLWHQKSQVGPPTSIGKWLLGGVIWHDAILAPLVFLACAVAWRFTGARVRRALALFLLAGGSLAIVGLPDLLRSGANPNPTVTPLDYPRNLAVALGAVAAVAVVSVVPGGLRERRMRVREARSRAQAEAVAALAKEQALVKLQGETRAEAACAPEAEAPSCREPESGARPSSDQPPTERPAAEKNNRDADDG